MKRFSLSMRRCVLATLLALVLVTALVASALAVGPTYNSVAGGGGSCSSCYHSTL
jgi:hypothetical protein